MNILAALGGVKPTLRERTQMLQRDMIPDSLDKNRGSISIAAKELGKTERMMRYKIQKRDIVRKPLQKTPDSDGPKKLRSWITLLPRGTHTLRLRPSSWLIQTA